MHPRFINWLKKQDYDWNIPYNQKHRIQWGGRIWMLKHVYDYQYPTSLPISVVYKWDRIIELNYELCIKHCQ